MFSLNHVKPSDEERPDLYHQRILFSKADLHCWLRYFPLLSVRMTGVSCLCPFGGSNRLERYFNSLCSVIDWLIHTYQQVRLVISRCLYYLAEITWSIWFALWISLRAYNISMEKLCVGCSRPSRLSNGCHDFTLHEYIIKTREIKNEYRLSNSITQNVCSYNAIIYKKSVFLLH